MAAPAHFSNLDCVQMQKEKCITLVISRLAPSPARVIPNSERSEQEERVNK